MGQSLIIEWGGDKVEFGVAKLPWRKRQCLYRVHRGMVEPLAYFRNEKDAEAFDQIIDLIDDAINGSTA